MTDAPVHAEPPLTRAQRWLAWASPYRWCPEQWPGLFQDQRQLFRWAEALQSNARTWGWILAWGAATALAAAVHAWAAAAPLLLITVVTLCGERWALLDLKQDWDSMQRNSIELMAHRGNVSQLLHHVPSRYRSTQWLFREVLSWRPRTAQELHQLVPHFLQAGADLNARDDFWGGTPLELVCGSLEHSQLLLKYGAVPSNPPGTMILGKRMSSRSFASQWIGQLHWTENAVKRGEKWAEAHRITTYEWAVASLDLWLAHGWQMPDHFAIHSFRYSGYCIETLLTAAFDFGLMPVVLLERGADPRLRNDNGDSFLDLLIRAEQQADATAQGAYVTPAQNAERQRLAHLRAAWDAHASSGLVHAIDAVAPTPATPARRPRL